jgi:calcium-dependent protein kinase
MGSSCCIKKNNNFVIDRIIIKNQSGKRNSLNSQINLVLKSRRTSVYIINNEDINQKYIFQEQIGTGYYGTVKVAVPKIDQNKKYACKSIDKLILSNNRIKSLIKEIETLSMLDHPNVIKYYETYNDNRYFHIVMELCSGGDLFDNITKRKYFSEKEACHIIYKLLSAILHCHSLGIVHRDLKPENILYESKSKLSEVKIIDFGLSQQSITDDDLNSIVGSPFYVAPEVLDGKYDSKCDLWSIGVITYCLLSGTPPFFSKDKEALFKMIRKDSVKFNKKIWESTSEQAKDFIKYILNKNHKKRPNARKALQHKWFENILKEDTNLNHLDVGILNSLRNFQEPRQLTKSVLTFIVKKLKNTEINQLNKSFNILDKDKSGFIDIEQLQKAFEFCNIKIDDEELKEIFHRCAFSKYKSKDNIEKINYTAFIAAAMDRKNLINRNLLWEVFKNFDSDSKGYISLNDFEKAIERTGKKKSIDEIKSMYKELGLSSDVFIRFEDFCEIIEKDL